MMVQFPARGVGRISRQWEEHGEGSEVGPARGPVELPEGELWLRVSADASEDTSWMRDLPADAFAGIAFDRAWAPDALAPLARLTGLRWLHLGYALLGGAAFVHLEPLTWLEDLDVCAAWGISEDLHRLRGHVALRRLGLYETSAGDDDLPWLAGMRELGYLDLGYSRVTDRGMAAVARFTKLEELELNEDAVGDAGVAAFAPSLLALRELRLARTKVTDGAIDELARLRNLRWLDVQGTAISPAGLARLRAALPGCSVSA